MRRGKKIRLNERRRERCDSRREKEIMVAVPVFQIGIKKGGGGKHGEHEMQRTRASMRCCRPE
jgi:hypothetical protein